VTDGKFTLRDGDGQALIRAWHKDGSVALAASTADNEAISMDPAEARDLAAALLRYAAAAGNRLPSPGQPEPGPGDWIDVGEVTAANRQILIIAAHTYRPSPDIDLPMEWTDLVAYNVMHRKRDPHARHDSLHVEMLAPGYEGSVHRVPSHRSESAVLVTTPSKYMTAVAEGRLCDDPDWFGYCELRIRLHDHNDPGVLTDDDDDEQASGEPEPG